MQLCMWHKASGCWRQQARRASKGWGVGQRLLQLLLLLLQWSTCQPAARSDKLHTPSPLLTPAVCSPPVLDPATVCSAKLAVQDAAILAVSADQLLLACVSGSTVRIYSLPHLLSHQSDLPAHTLQMEQPLMQFSWCPDERQDTQFLALTAGRLLLHGSLSSGSATIAEQVDCASWSPDGQHIAYTSASKLVVTGVDWKDSAFKVDLPPPDDQRTSLWGCACV